MIASKFLVRDFGTSDLDGELWSCAIGLIYLLTYLLISPVIAVSEWSLTNQDR